MELQLVYSEKKSGAVLGAFIPGAKPADWFRELDSWQVPIASLRCFVLPLSLAENSAGGLFVVFDGKALPQLGVVRYPYTRLADQLFIPLNACLQPALAIAELKTLLLWELQVFHPVIGLVGFEAKDEVILGSLLRLSKPLVSDWSLAHPGNMPAPPLQMIGLEAEEAPEDVLDTIKAEVNTKPLSEIPASDPGETELDRQGKKALNLLTKAGLYLLLFFTIIGPIILAIIALGLLALLVKQGSFPTGGLVPLLIILGRVIFKIPGLFSLGGRSSVDTSNKQGLFQRTKQWLNQRLDELEKKRDSELKRLVDLFDKDTDEALQYAIPLSSPYLDRGTAPASALLSRRSLDFNLRKLGGGGRVDGWDLGDYNRMLRDRYEKAANDAIAAGNFKRAAYVYAHLLGNFFSAANVLQQGKCYREAAAIHKDHLNNERMAAECLEKGGLLAEAIPLYIHLNLLEKAGDLYRLLGQEDKAVLHYRQRQLELKAAGDHLQAAALTREKLNEEEEGLNLLLEGWRDSKNAERCLEVYLGHFAETEPGALVPAVKKVYTQQVPRLKRTSFLNVLVVMAAKMPEGHFRAASLDMAYEIVHQQASAGDTSGLQLLGRFLPQDRLVGGDTNRFVQNRLSLPPLLSGASYLELDKYTTWLSLAVYHDQLLAIGLKKDELHFLRMNWEGKTNDRYLFKVPAGAQPYYLVTDSGLSEQALVMGESLNTYLEQKLESYSYFDRELLLRSVNYLPGGNLACCLNAASGVTVLHFHMHGLVLSHFNLKGDLLKTHDCKIEDERFHPGQARFEPGRMVWRKDHFYYYLDNLLLRLSFTGEAEVLALEEPIVKISVSGPHTALKIAVLTSDGAFMVTPLLKEMQVSSERFAHDLQGTDIQLLTDNRLVITDAQSAAVFDTRTDTPGRQSTIHTEQAIKAVLPVPKRHHCAFLEADNRLSVYDLSQVP
ncbi:MAG: cyclic nucleotide-binding protein [Mucilaginibacter sp.]|nr:cyclic nucleotide-binding protein [Mucilaginibacter sp.]